MLVLVSRSFVASVVLPAPKETSPESSSARALLQPQTIKLATHTHTHTTRFGNLRLTESVERKEKKNRGRISVMTERGT